MRIPLVVVACCAGLLACKDTPTAAPEVAPGPPPTTVAPANRTPNELLTAPRLTVVRGTLGDDRADRTVAAQAAILAGVMRDVTLIDDTAFDHTWPDGLVLYGGPHVNAVVAELAPTLPFTMAPGRLTIGDATFEGDDIRLIAAVPAGPAAATDAPTHKGFLLYAGSGMPGVAEINAVKHGPDPIVVADAFGPLVTGRWTLRAGQVVAALGERARRIAWTTLTRELPLPSGPATIRFHTPKMLELAPDDPRAAEQAEEAKAAADACLAGIATAASKLELERVEPLDVYVYPDPKSKQSLTGDAGDGHAVPAAHALHVVSVPPDRLAPLVAHEATHVLATDAWGLAGTAIMGEGLAVWVAGAYAGVPLDRLTLAPGERPTLAQAVLTFRKLPERIGYTYGGQLVAAAHELGGLGRVRAMYAGTLTNWRDVWTRQAGLVPEVLEAEVARRVGGGAAAPP